MDKFDSSEAGCFRELIDLLGEKKAVATDILKVTERINELLDCEELEQIEDLLDYRQHLMERIDALSVQIDLIYLEVREGMSENGLELFSSIQQATAEIWRQVQAEDRRAVSGAKHKLLELRRRISEVDSQKKGLAAYTESRQFPEGVLLDEKK